LTKVKLIAQTGVSEALRKEVRGAGVKGGMSLALKDYLCRNVVTVKPIAPKTCSFKQLVQRRKWCQADYMWRMMSEGQKRLWRKYYWRERAMGRTLRKDVRVAGREKVMKGQRDMGYYALFMKRAMDGKLGDFLRNFLGATFHLKAIERTEDEVILTFNFCRHWGEPLPIEPREVKLERIRL